VGADGFHRHCSLFDAGTGHLLFAKSLPTNPTIDPTRCYEESGLLSTCNHTISITHKTIDSWA